MLNQFYFLFEWYYLESELEGVVADLQRCVCCLASKLQNSSFDSCIQDELLILMVLVGDC